MWRPPPCLSLLLLLLPAALPVTAFMPVPPSPPPSQRLALSPTTASGDRPRVFIFGLGYVGERLADSLTSSSSPLLGPGVEAIRLALQASTHVISTVGPSGPALEDPVLQSFHEDLCSSSSLQWLAYLSSTSVYGDRDGAWVSEDDEALPTTDKGRARLEAEARWGSLAGPNCCVHIFRLAGIYGPGRSAFDTLVKAGQGTAPPYRYSPRAGPGEYGPISRVHVHDIVRVMEAAMVSPPDAPGGVAVYNVADDCPASRHEVFTWAAQELNHPTDNGEEGNNPATRSQAPAAAPPDLPTRVRGGSKRVSNDKVKREVLAPVFGPPGAFLFPSYRAGLPSCRPVK